MENYIAAMFSTLEDARGAAAALVELSRHGKVQLHRAGLYHRGERGEYVSEDSGTGAVTQLAVSDFPKTTDGTAALDLERVLTPGMHALLAHVEETDPRPVNEAMDAFDGVVYRRSVEQIETSARHPSGPSRLE